MILSTNVAFVGHTHHGKSSLLGRYLHDAELLSEHQIRAARRCIESGRVPKSHFYALLVHRNPREDIRQLTELPSWIRARAGVAELTLIDTPGHDIYHKHMVYGVFQADYAVLVVQAQEGIQAQTVDALNLLRNFEIPLLAMTVSRMDEVGYSEERYSEVVGNVRALLGGMGLPLTVPALPSSAIDGEGVLEHRHAEWARGLPTLESVLRGAAVRPSRSGDRPARFVFRRAELYASGQGMVLVGIVESGQINVGDRLLVEPASQIRGRETSFRIKSIHLVKGRHGQESEVVESAEPRQVVGVAADFGSFDFRDFLLSAPGHAYVAGPREHPPGVAERIAAEVLVVEHPTAIPVGYRPVLNINGDQVGCVFEGITAKRHPGCDWADTAETLIRSEEQARLGITFGRPVVVEPGALLPRLSKFVIRDNHRIVALGKALRAVTDTEKGPIAAE